MLSTGQFFISGLSHYWQPCGFLATVVCSTELIRIFCIPIGQVSLENFPCPVYVAPIIFNSEIQADRESNIIQTTPYRICRDVTNNAQSASFFHFYYGLKWLFLGRNGPSGTRTQGRPVMSRLLWPTELKVLSRIMLPDNNSAVAILNRQSQQRFLIFTSLSENHPGRLKSL